MASAIQFRARLTGMKKNSTHPFISPVQAFCGPPGCDTSTADAQEGIEEGSESASVAPLTPGRSLWIIGAGM